MLSMFDTLVLVMHTFCKPRSDDGGGGGGAAAAAAVVTATAAAPAWAKEGEGASTTGQQHAQDQENSTAARHLRVGALLRVSANTSGSSGCGR